MDDWSWELLSPPAAAAALDGNVAGHAAVCSNYFSSRRIDGSTSEESLAGSVAPSWFDPGENSETEISFPRKCVASGSWIEGLSDSSGSGGERSGFFGESSVHNSESGVDGGSSLAQKVDIEVGVYEKSLKGSSIGAKLDTGVELREISDNCAEDSDFCPKRHALSLAPTNERSDLEETSSDFSDRSELAAKSGSRADVGSAKTREKGGDNGGNRRRCKLLLQLAKIAGSIVMTPWALPVVTVAALALAVVLQKHLHSIKQLLRKLPTLRLLLSERALHFRDHTASPNSTFSRVRCAPTINVPLAASNTIPWPVAAFL